MIPALAGGKSLSRFAPSAADNGLKQHDLIARLDLHAVALLPGHKLRIESRGNALRRMPQCMHQRRERAAGRRVMRLAIEIEGDFARGGRHGVGSESGNAVNMPLF